MRTVSTTIAAVVCALVANTGYCGDATKNRIVDTYYEHLHYERRLPDGLSLYHVTYYRDIPGYHVSDGPGFSYYGQSSGRRNPFTGELYDVFEANLEDSYYKRDHAQTMSRWYSTNQQSYYTNSRYYQQNRPTSYFAMPVHSEFSDGRGQSVFVTDYYGAPAGVSVRSVGPSTAEYRSYYGLSYYLPDSERFGSIYYGGSSNLNSEQKPIYHIADTYYEYRHYEIRQPGGESLYHVTYYHKPGFSYYGPSSGRTHPFTGELYDVFTANLQDDYYQRDHAQATTDRSISLPGSYYNRGSVRDSDSYNRPHTQTMTGWQLENPQSYHAHVQRGTFNSYYNGRGYYSRPALRYNQRFQ